MPNCFWKLCHCPDAQPCVEHAGTGCSIVNGAAITDEAQIDDAITRAGEVAVGKLGTDTQRAEAITRNLEARKAQLERERSDLERQGNEANSMSERRAVVEQQRVLARRHAGLSDELKALTDEIDALGNTAQVVVAPLSAALQIPYSDSTGYCACYQEKLKQLTALATKITAEQATQAAANAAYNAARAAVIPKLRFTITIAAGVVILVFVILGVPAGAVIAAFLALMFTAIVVVGLAVQLGVRRAALLQSRARLYKLWLSYYRIQQIPTCSRYVDVDDDETESEAREERKHGGGGPQKGERSQG